MGKWIKFYIADSGHVDSETGYWDEGQPSPPPLAAQSDIYQPDYLRWLLKLCQIEAADWILRKYDPGRIVQVCCYAIAKRNSGTVRTGVRQIVLAALRDGYDVPDYRQQVLPDIARAVPSAAETDEKVRAVQQVDTADREHAHRLLQAFLFDLKNEDGPDDQTKKRKRPRGKDAP